MSGDASARNTTFKGGEFVDAAMSAGISDKPSKYRPRGLADQQSGETMTQGMAINRTRLVECIENSRNILIRVRKTGQENSLKQNISADHFLHQQRAERLRHRSFSVAAHDHDAPRRSMDRNRVLKSMTRDQIRHSP